MPRIRWLTAIVLCAWAVSVAQVTEGGLGRPALMSPPQADTARTSILTAVAAATVR